MRSLHLSGPGEDGTSLVLDSDDGEQFSLPVDETLRAAVTSTLQANRSPGASGQVELTPREIQVRVRAGESPDELADESGAPVERIMRFAFPVLEERARVAEEARRSRARRDGDGALVPFGDTVDARFAAHAIDPAEVAWDAVRRPDGTWLVIATWHGGDTDRRAHWAFSLTARTVLPADEVAGDLLSERPLRPVVRAVPDRPEPQDTSGDARRDTRSAGPDAADAPAGQGDAVYDQDAGAPAPVVPIVSSDWSPSGPHPVPTGDPLPPAPPVPDRHEAMAPPQDHAVPLPLHFETPDAPAPSASAPEPGLSVLESYPTGPIPLDEELFGTDEAPAEDEPAPPTRRGGGRGKAAREQTKIPSWDDILLGVRRRQD